MADAPPAQRPRTRAAYQRLDETWEQFQARKQAIASRHQQPGATPGSAPGPMPPIQAPPVSPTAETLTRPIGELPPDQLTDGKVYRQQDGTYARWDAAPGQATPVQWDPAQRDWAVPNADPGAARLAQKHAEMAQEYTFHQQRQLEEITNAENWVRGQDDWTAEQKADALGQLAAKRMGIKPSERPREAPQFPQGQSVGDYWKDPDTGAVLTRDRNGDVRVLQNAQPAPNQLSMRDVMTLRKDAVTALTKVDPDTASETPPSEEQVEEFIRKTLELHQRLSGGQAGAQGGGGAPTAASSAAPRPVPVNQVPPAILRRPGVRTVQPNGEEVEWAINPDGTSGWKKVTQK
jgi:hypothetical protein